MKKIQVEIKGTVALLQHRFATEEHGVNTTRSKKRVYIPEEEAEKAAYRDSNTKDLVQPSEHILGCLIKAGTQFKFEGKKTYKEIIKAGIVIEPEYITLTKPNNDEPLKAWDEVDSRAVVVQRARVIRWRPRINEWKLCFEIIILNDDEIGISTLKEMLDYAGRLGIGDYRPRFGRFMVTKFEELT